MNPINGLAKTHTVNSDTTKAYAHDDDGKEHDHDLEGGATSDTVEERYSMWSYHEKLLIITLTGSASMLS